jgi:hypothetical protein
MLRFVADENLNGAISRGLLRRRPALDLVRLQDVGLSGISDPDLLAWAANEQRLVLTHDVTTLREFAEARTRAGLAMPGVIEVGEHLPIRDAIEDLLLIAECSYEGEWEGRVCFLPLR